MASGNRSPLVRVNLSEVLPDPLFAHSARFDRNAEQLPFNQSNTIIGLLSYLELTITAHAAVTTKLLEEMRARGYSEDVIRRLADAQVEVAKLPDMFRETNWEFYAKYKHSLFEMKGAREEHPVNV